MTIRKYVGDPFTTTVSVRHRGAPISVDLGIGLAGTGLTPGVDEWFFRTVEMGADRTEKLYTVVISDTIPDIALGVKDVLKWAQEAGGARDRRGDGMLVADWDKTVYEILERTGGGTPTEPPGSGAGFDSLDASWDPPAGSFLRRGQTIHVIETFFYKGASGPVQVGVGFAPHRSWFEVHRPVSDFTVVTASLPSNYDRKLITVEYNLRISDSMEPGSKDVLKFIQKTGLGLDPGGNGYILADWDDAVFEVTS